MASSREGGLKFCNRRAEDWWRMREALDPGQEFGSAIALPPDASIKADLAAPRWEMTAGDGVRDFQVGDLVADMTVVGSNATYLALRADDLTKVPAGVDAAEAATLILSWTTAYQLLHRAARVQRGQRVLVHGAAGAVGQAQLALGRLAGLELWGASRGEHAALIRELGAHANRLPTRGFRSRPAGRI
jgi:NADPH:quinone reductase-like Zn-dependent oxidoreductase